ncbi:glycoside hydrolase family 35 protein [Actinoalloteichus caeruleus]|uniref:glycoside hydrolase family 35 protein n=1 Tax=Actinoalloteichus cyanogriseus TaxID=2893586 RepID=UPI0004BF4ADD|nr:beta-galactosidase family protein [Actinoalloteichus caeruleus]
MPEFAIGDDDFLLDGKPTRIISGALHYFRVHPDQWEDRLRKARLMGLNTVETYVPWNLHQPTPDDLTAEDGLDLPRFLRLAGAEGLHVLLRPGPYICAEWESGGLPAWLLAEPGVRLRSTDPTYLAAVERFLARLLPLVVPHLVTRGGPVLAVQVENEFGAYGRDQEYLERVAEFLRAGGVDVPLFTSDQPSEEMLAAGGLPGVLRTGNFGSRVAENLARLREGQPTGPLMCMEFWHGWFDRWGGPHHVREPEDAASTLDELLAAGASVNFYMFHGGTSFGFLNGANDNGRYLPTVNSYDYDAPLSESGDPTPKFAAFREVIARYAPVPDEPVPARGPRLPETAVSLDESAALLPAVDFLAEGVAADRPLTMEELGQAYGFVLYRTTLPAAVDGVLVVEDVHDRAQVFVDGAPVGVLEREHRERALALRAPAGARLDLLVENQGRVNYGEGLADRKGVLGGVFVDGTEVTGWSCHPLPLSAEQLAAAPYSPATGLPAGPGLHRGTVRIEQPADTFVSLPDWTKGVVWINGFALGRYWRRGPQRTLYVPGPVLRPGVNDIVVLELEAATSRTLMLVPEPDLGHTQE